MRIGFQGKGGAGKSTLAAGFILSQAQRGQFVLAVDADVNVHLQRCLGIAGTPKFLGENSKAIASYLAGERTDISIDHMISSTPPSTRSRLVRPTPNDALVRQFGLFGNNIALLIVGSYSAEDRGNTCYHGMLHGWQMMVHHMIDRPSEIVAVDSTAGVDSLGSTLHIAYDLNVFVVEPTLRSITVVNDFVEKSGRNAAEIVVVGNKVRSEKDRDFILKSIPKSLRLVGCIGHSDEVAAFDRGELEDLSQFAKANRALFDELTSIASSIRRDHAGYYKKIVSMNKLLGESWYDAYFGTKISDVQDLDFSYEAFIQTSSPATHAN